jgi:ligand-binding sensor domain-containing protein
MRYAIVFLWLLCVMCVIKPFAQTPNYQFSRIDIKKGLSHNQVNAIFKDSKGFVWFGTMSGLNRFDGYRFRVFRNDAADANSISDNYIEKILEGPDETIWVFTRNGINVFDPRTEKFDRNASLAVNKYRLPDGNIADIFRDKGGSFCFLNTAKGLVQYNPSQKMTRQLVNRPGDSNSISSNDVVSVTEDADKHLWLIHRNGVVERSC